MKHYAGLDVSVKETSICIVDEAGRICREMKVVSPPEDLLAVLCDSAWRNQNPLPYRLATPQCRFVSQAAARGGWTIMRGGTHRFLSLRG